MTWRIETERGTTIAAGYTTREAADSALQALRDFVAGSDGIPPFERELAAGARVEEDFDWTPLRMRLFRGLT